MRARRISLPALAVAAFALGCVGADATVRVGGTGTTIAVLQQLGARFGAALNVDIVIIRSLGSSGSLRALADRKLDLVIVGRPLTGQEAAAGLREAMTLRTAYVLATSRPKPGSLASTDVARIFRAGNPVWPDGSALRIILRPRTDTDSELMSRSFPGMKEALEAARQRPELPTAATDQDNADLAERLAGSLTGITATQIKTEGLMLNTIAIDGVDPSLANFESGAYRYAKTLHVVVRDVVDPEAGRVIEFLRSPDGLQFLRDAEILPEPK